MYRKKIHVHYKHLKIFFSWHNPFKEHSLPIVVELMWYRYPTYGNENWISQLSQISVTGQISSWFFSLFQTPDKPKEPVIDQYKNPVMSLNELRPGLTYEVKHMNTYCRIQAKKNF